MIRKRMASDLEAWMADAEASLIASSAKGIRRGSVVVSATMPQPWSNGQTESQITKLKLVKRQMCGRGKLDLLQARLIGAPLRTFAEIESEPRLRAGSHYKVTSPSCAR